MFNIQIPHYSIGILYMAEYEADMYVELFEEEKTVHDDQPFGLTLIPIDHNKLENLCNSIRANWYLVEAKKSAMFDARTYPVNRKFSYKKKFIYIYFVSWANKGLLKQRSQQNMKVSKIIISEGLQKIGNIY